MAKKRILLIIAALLFGVFVIFSWIGTSWEFIKYVLVQSLRYRPSGKFDSNFFEYGIETWLEIFKEIPIYSSSGRERMAVLTALFTQHRMSSMGEWWWIMCNIGRMLSVGLLFIALIVKAIWIKMPKFLFAIPFAFLLLWDFLFSVEAFSAFTTYGKQSTDALFAYGCEWNIYSLFAFADLILILLLFLNKKLSKIKIIGKILFAIPFVLIGWAAVVYMMIMGTWIAGRDNYVGVHLFSDLQILAYICAFIGHLIIGFVVVKEPVEMKVIAKGEQ